VKRNKNLKKTKNQKARKIRKMLQELEESHNVHNNEKLNHLLSLPYLTSRSVNKYFSVIDNLFSSFVL